VGHTIAMNEDHRPYRVDQSSRPQYESRAPHYGRTFGGPELILLLPEGDGCQEIGAAALRCQANPEIGTLEV